MKKWWIGFIFLIVFLVEIFIFVFMIIPSKEIKQDVVAVNEVVNSLKNDWNTIDEHINETKCEYVVLNNKDEVIYKTKEGISDSINLAIEHQDTILFIEIDNQIVGRVIIYNTSSEVLMEQKRVASILFSVVTIIQVGLCGGYFLLIYKNMIMPFHRLKGFAESIAGGNLDAPLTMDRMNIFGAFTESFDIMRSELKKARLAEAKANISKKELVAKLSHDIKTPVASIKAAAEVGQTLAKEKKLKENYTQIVTKADQINVLINNLFTATLEELEQLNVSAIDMNSQVVKDMLKAADYLGFARIPDIPECMVYIDKLRLQQVFDNIFANSYKYANTKIEVKTKVLDSILEIHIEDFGKGVLEEELPLLKEKFKRGSNANTIEGAGLGLYISDYFMKEMNGNLIIENGKHGLKVIVCLSLSGTI
ncbi:MAG: HAMP domain-containing histidine kinase [Anaeroplasma bactoclasticum]|nr:HAMP domain-containing histidine kinase [Anaeroplasma bactoclasticum]MCM1556393.1 HAMP domain-containing histidine kinase [Anaeroplasma bactoclasticum]